MTKKDIAEFFEALTVLAKEKGIEVDYLLDRISAAIVVAVKKDFGGDENIIVNMHPEILLMDEPFGALDEVLRDQLNLELLDLWQKQGQTIIFITHSIREAVFLSDRVLVMNTNPGRIVDEITVDLPRPRSYETFTSKRFMELTDQITSLIGEVNLKDIV